MEYMVYIPILLSIIVLCIIQISSWARWKSSLPSSEDSWTGSLV